MAAEGDLINFDIIENQKENIQSLPQGRSAKALAATFSPSPFSPVQTPGSTRNLNDAIRAEYEKEILEIGDSDDPLDVYDRYVKWTLNSYPSAQATPESQLRPLLERATKAFQSSADYKNDPRYLKLWMHYIRFFSDAPREAFAYLARHNIGERLALFYEEFASWLEGADRWAQAEEVYKLGIEREARPAERLLRKFGEFQTRFEQRPQGTDGPSSPALPTVRPALAAKVDPFASTPTPQDPQAQRLPSNSNASRSGKSKLTIFSDADEPDSASRPGSNDNSKGWENIGTVDERRKENVIGAKPWVGETLKAGKKVGTTSKMMIFKDETNAHLSQAEPASTSAMASQQQSVNPRTGRVERVFVNLEAVYSNPNDLTEEYSFEELRAKHRGWMNLTWSRQQPTQSQATQDTREDSQKSNDSTSTIPLDSQEETTGNISNGDQTLSELTLGGSLKPRERKSGRTKQKKFMEIKGETQTVQLNMDSQTGRKVRRKSTREPTMTLHTKAATDDILDIFNQPLRNDGQLGADADSAEESDYDEEDYTGYTSAGDSTGTGGMSAPASEMGDEDTTTTRSEVVPEPTEAESTSPWSDFTLSKHKPNLENYDFDNMTQTGEIDNKTEELTSASGVTDSNDVTSGQDNEEDSGQLNTAASPRRDNPEDPYTKTIAITPEDYEAPTHPYRDAKQVAQNRLPFMTPIVEQTESSISSVKPQKDYFNSKTPSRKRDGEGVPLQEMEDLLISSPLKEIVNNATPTREKSGGLGIGSKGVLEMAVPLGASKPIIKDRQCNPVDESIRKTIINSIEPPLAAFEGYYDHGSTVINKGPEVRKYIKAIVKSKTDKTMSSLPSPPVLVLDGPEPIEYSIRRELGKGAFAPVYLASGPSSQPLTASLSSQPLVAIKAEQPPNPWEFYILRVAHNRLLSSTNPTYHRTSASLTSPYSFHLFSDEAYLVETYHDQGTLLDLANLARADAAASGIQGAACDECVAVFFAAELLRSLEALHAVGVLHGDIKADNCLVRLSALADGQNSWTPNYRADGAGGWASKGLALIDLGRGVDMRAFTPNAQFVADWKTSRQDCPEQRDLRPWTFHADYWGAAGVLHVLLYGRWIEDVQEAAGRPGSGGGASAGAGGAGGNGSPEETGDSSSSSIAGNKLKRYRLKDGFKRYWQTDLWAAVFDLLMNPAAHADNGVLPATARVAEVRGLLEAWLEENSEKKGLKAQLKKYEERLRANKRA